jgi:hypothetical protein
LNSEFGIRNSGRAAERAVFNIVGHLMIQVGKAIGADNVEGGNSREARAESRRAGAVPETPDVQTFER